MNGDELSAMEWPFLGAYLDDVQMALRLLQEADCELSVKLEIKGGGRDLVKHVDLGVVTVPLTSEVRKELREQLGRIRQELSNRCIVPTVEQAAS